MIHQEMKYYIKILANFSIFIVFSRIYNNIKYADPLRSNSVGLSRFIPNCTAEGNPQGSSNIVL